MMPTSGRAASRLSTKAAASPIWLRSWVAMSPGPAAERVLDATAHLAFVQLFHLDHLGARAGAAHHRHPCPRDSEDPREQGLDRAVRAPALRRGGHGELERAVP